MKTVRNVVASAILAALVFVLLRFVAIPTPFPDTTLSIYAAVVAFFAVLFGPAVGFVGGFLGSLIGLRASGFIGTILLSVLGACVFTWAYSKFMK